VTWLLRVIAHHLLGHWIVWLGGLLALKALALAAWWLHHSGERDQAVRDSAAAIAAQEEDLSIRERVDETIRGLLGTDDNDSLLKPYFRD